MCPAFLTYLLRLRRVWDDEGSTHFVYPLGIRSGNVLCLYTQMTTLFIYAERWRR